MGLSTALKCYHSSIEDRKNCVKIKENKEHSELYKEIVDVIKQKNIKYNEVKKFSEQISISEKINRLATGDMTAGSCSSLAFAYIGNKHGFDVLDFRPGYAGNGRQRRAYGT